MQLSIESIKIKYGVINKEYFLKDLYSWNNIYAAGRLHKPVLILKSCPDIEKAIDVNRRFAVCTSLLLLPQK